MVKIITFHLLVLLAGCTIQNNPDLVKRKIELEDGLGTVSVLLPLEFDTFYTFTRSNDYLTDQWYAYSNCDYTLHKNTIGWIQGSEFDSMLEFTVMHIDLKLYRDLAEEERSLEEIKEEELKLWKAIQPSSEITSRIEKINRKEFIIFEVKGQPWTLKNHIVRAYTIHNGILIYFSFKCYKTDCGDFCERANELVKTIRIK
jgi:hypothetical protein